MKGLDLGLQTCVCASTAASNDRAVEKLWGEGRWCAPGDFQESQTTINLIKAGKRP